MPRREPLDAVEDEGAPERLANPLVVRRFEQVREQGAVDQDERTVTPRALGVHHPGDELLAGAAIAHEDDTGVAARHDRGAIRERPHRWREGDELGAGPPRHHAFPRRLELAQERSLRRDGPEDVPHELVGVERLGHVARRAVAQRVDHVGNARVARHHDDRRLGRLATDAPEEREPVDPGHPHVADGDVEGLLPDELRSLRPIGGLGHVMALVL